MSRCKQCLTSLLIRYSSNYWMQIQHRVCVRWRQTGNNTVPEAGSLMSNNSERDTALCKRENKHECHDEISEAYSLSVVSLSNN